MPYFAVTKKSITASYMQAAPKPENSSTQCSIVDGSTRMAAANKAKSAATRQTSTLLRRQCDQTTNMLCNMSLIVISQHICVKLAVACEAKG
jgi:hypothetical protein